MATTVFGAPALNKAVLICFASPPISAGVFSVSDHLRSPIVELDLYQRVALTRDLPDEGLKKGDVDILIDFVAHLHSNEAVAVGLRIVKP
jgi:hypothetical protein